MEALIGVSPYGFLLASLLVILAPGPDMALVARNTIASGRAAGFQTAGGALLGVSVHVLAAVAGLSAILLGSAVAFSVVKVIGAAYLVLLGTRAILSAGTGSGGGEGALLGGATPGVVAARTSPVAQGMLSAVLNPKLAVFFLTFLPQFVDRDRMPEASMVAHGAVFVVMGAVWLSVWVLSLDRLAAVLRRDAVRAWLERATGAVLVAMGLRLAFERR